MDIQEGSVTSNQQPEKKNIKSFEDLEIWGEAYKLTLEVYKTTRRFPRKELYGLVSQLRRAAISVAANIAEGHSRDTTKEFIRFLFNARGSIAEIECHLMLAKDLRYLDIEITQELRGRYRILGKRVNALY